MLIPIKSKHRARFTFPVNEGCCCTKIPMMYGRILQAHVSRRPPTPHACILLTNRGLVARFSKYRIQAHVNRIIFA